MLNHKSKQNPILGFVLRLNYLLLIVAVGMSIHYTLFYSDAIYELVFYYAVTAILIGNSYIIKKSWITKQEVAQLNTQLEQKNMLLKEVHHRVKNNLQTVSSLLSIQSRGVDDENTKKLLKNSQRRVLTMAMIHEMLYKKDEHVELVPLAPYLQELSESLIASSNAKNSLDINLELNIPDVNLKVDTIISLGLIVNEIITNSIKYAFNPKEKGIIYLKIEQHTEYTYQLNIGDNGVGFSKENSEKPSNSMGLKLIESLARQIKGDIKKSFDLEENGTHYTLTFKDQ
ncbi:MAG: sensor histidine kinase [Flavobacteriaceae bacterium]